MELDKLKPVVNTQVWPIFTDYLQEKYDAKHKEMDRITDINDLFKAQGYCQAIREIQELRDRANVK